jgi:hypothetical protein
MVHAASVRAASALTRSVHRETGLSEGRMALHALRLPAVARSAHSPKEKPANARKPTAHLATDLSQIYQSCTQHSS